MALTMVRQPPTSAPCSATCGRPSRRTPRSVVVPPMSDMMKSRRPQSHEAPTRLAAGPDNTVSMGRSATRSARASVPSPFTIISGQSMPSSAMDLRTAVISMEMREMSLALSTAVSARRGASSDEVSSVDSVTGLPVTRATRSRAACSCAGLRTAKADAMAKASTGMAAAAASSATASSRCASAPVWSWPPAIIAMGMPGKALAMPVRSAMAWSKPMRMTPTALPWPSTTALVASVVETETSAMFSG